MKLTNIILLLLLILETVNCASLEGNVYDIGLDKVNNAIVEINTVPLQRIVAEKGTYAFKSIPSGNYQIKAYTSDKKIETIENITIEEDGIYTYDIFLIPELEEEQTTVIWPYILIIIVTIIIFLIILYKLKKPKKEAIDQDLDYIVNIIKEEGNRMVQRDLVQKTGLSEAKISLMITDLESKGILKKIRKGRANILILNK